MKYLLRGLLLVLIFALVAIASAYLTVRLTRHKPKPAAKIPDIKITLLEGWSGKEMAAYLDRQGIVPADDFLSAVQGFPTGNYPLLQSRPARANLEGFLFPDTYLISKRPSSTPRDVADEIISRQLDNFSQKFTDKMQAQAASDKMSVYEIVTLASIIEKETGRQAVTAEQKQSLDAERAIIAGIFYNRLSAGMPLQSDATINYITGKNDPQASAADTAIDSPYNTYKYAGLPPGPICNPSLSSLLAALYPAKTDYFYFLHRQDTGQAVYAVTYQEHLQNKAKYLKN